MRDSPSAVSEEKERDVLFENRVYQPAAPVLHARSASLLRDQGIAELRRHGGRVHAAVVSMLHARTSLRGISAHPSRRTASLYADAASASVVFNSSSAVNCDRCSREYFPGAVGRLCGIQPIAIRLTRTSPATGGCAIAPQRPRFIQQRLKHRLRSLWRQSNSLQSDSRCLTNCDGAYLPLLFRPDCVVSIEEYGIRCRGARAQKNRLCVLPEKTEDTCWCAMAA